jgi:membrane-associated phospholipid phosphatase
MRSIVYTKKLLFFCFIIIGLNTSFAQSRLQQWDDNVMINLAERRTEEKTGILLFLSNTYRYGDVGIPAGLLIGGIVGNDRQMRENALYVASSTAISYGLTELLKLIVKRPRPYIQNIRIVPVYRAMGTSFPSGHTSSTIATATALSMAYPKWYVIAPAFLWAGSVSYSRVYLGVHYPTDVSGGALLGAGTAASLSFMRANQ